MNKLNNSPRGHKHVYSLAECPHCGTYIYNEAGYRYHIIEKQCQKGIPYKAPSWCKKHWW